MNDLTPANRNYDNHELRSTFSLREPLYLLFKRKKQITSVFVATVVLVIIASYVLPRTYESSAKIFVERHVPPFASTSAPRTFFMSLDRKEVLNSEVDLIQSRVVAERVVERLDAEDGPQDGPPRRSVFRFVRDLVRGTLIAVGLNDPPGDEREGRIASLQKKIKAEPALQSNTITITYRASNPEYAFRVVEAATDVYLVERLKLMKRPGLDAFYEEHIRRSGALLDALEEEESQLKRGTGIVSINEEIALKLDELSQLESALNMHRVASSEHLERIAALEEQISNEPETVTESRVVQRNPVVAELTAKRRELVDLRAAELSRFKPGSPPIEDLDRRIAAIEKALESEPETSTNSEAVNANSTRGVLQTALYAAEANYAASRSSEQSVRAQIQEVTIELRRLDAKEIELNRIAQSISSAERIYFNYKEQREEARIEANTDPSTANVKIIHRAVKPARPLFARLTLIGFGLVTGLSLGLGVAFVFEFFDHSLCTREDVERHLGLPVLGSLPESESVARPL